MRTIREVMNINISNMELSVRSTNGLKRMSINNLSDLTAKSQEDLRKIRNMGKKSIDEITEKIESIGLSFNMTDYDWAQWGLNHLEWIKTHDQSL